MTHAYDRICLDRAADTLGRMLDYSVYSLHYDIASMMDLFIASGLAALFEHGDIRVIGGMSGIELAYEVLERSGLSYDRTTPRHTISLSAEYWCGYALASIQWASAWSFDHVLKSFSAAAFTAEFGKKRIEYLDSLPLNISNSERNEKARTFGSDYVAEAVYGFLSSHSQAGDTSASNRLKETGDSPLKEMRIKNRLSQSQLAKACGIPVRTIQQYEQRQKDLSKARAEYLISLARALNCDPSYLINRK